MGKDKDKKSKEEISKSKDNKKLKVRSENSIETKNDKKSKKASKTDVAKEDKKLKKASKTDVTKDDKKSKKASTTDVTKDDKKSKKASKTDVTKDDKKSKKASKTDMTKDEKKLKKEQAKLDMKSKKQKIEDTRLSSNGKPSETYVVPKAEGAYPFLPSRFVMPRGMKGYVYSASPGPARYPVTDFSKPIMKAKKQEDLVKKMISGPSPPAFSLGVKHSDIRCFYNKIE